MAFTFGFYNSSNHDRVYDSEEFSRIFDGLITDGVYATIGNRFVVRAANEDNTIIVGSGRAWFKHSWSYNDTDMQMTGPASHALFNRWDAIVLDVNGEISYRTNSIIWITGDATSTPVKPTMIHTDKHNQYPLAYIYRPANNNAIPAVNITSCVGLDECPYTQGLVTDTKNIAPVENNDYASRAYNIGEYILWKNEFYKVTTAIAKNARIIPKPTSGYNITRSTMAEELYKTFTLDTVPTSGHYTNVVSSDGIYRALGNRSSIQTAAPASGGNNLITNGQVYTALGNRSIIQTSAPASGGNNLITNGQVYTALGNRTSIQTSAPALGSNDLITAGQVYSALGRSYIPNMQIVTKNIELSYNAQTWDLDSAEGSPIVYPDKWNGYVTYSGSTYDYVFVVGYVVSDGGTQQADSDEIISVNRLFCTYGNSSYTLYYSVAMFTNVLFRVRNKGEYDYLSSSYGRRNGRFAGKVYLRVYIAEFYH